MSHEPRLRFRTATSADAPEVDRLVNSAYRGESSKQGWTTEADILGGQRTDVGKLLEMIAAPDTRIELAYLGEALIGCVQLRREAGGACYLGMLTVDPTQQAGGFGKSLLAHSEQIAHTWSCDRVRMTVIQLRPELIAYYERRGYRRTGSTEPFPESDPRFGLPKVSGLQLVEFAKPLAG